MKSLHFLQELPVYAKGEKHEKTLGGGVIEISLY